MGMGLGMGPLDDQLALVGMGHGQDDEDMLHSLFGNGDSLFGTPTRAGQAVAQQQVPAQQLQQRLLVAQRQQH
jgi:hypothetical protein